MTRVQAARLVDRQIKTSLSSALKLSIGKKARINPVLFNKKLFLESTDNLILEHLSSYFKEAVLKHNDKTILTLLNHAASKKFNSNFYSRYYALTTLRDIAKENYSGALRGLLANARETNKTLHNIAWDGLKALAKRGNVKAISAMLVNVEYAEEGDQSKFVRWLKTLARKSLISANSIYKKRKAKEKS